MSLSRKTTTKLSHKPTIKKVRDKCLWELSGQTVPLPEKWEGEAVVVWRTLFDWEEEIGIQLPDDCKHLLGKKVVISLEVAE